MGRNDGFFQQTIKTLEHYILSSELELA